jgi:hypothetical protein
VVFSPAGAFVPCSYETAAIPPAMRCSVSNSGRNGQLRFCAGTRFAPEFHSRADAFRAEPSSDGY